MKLTFSLTSLLSLFAATAMAAESPPHIVIILVDDFGYGDPGCYNSDSKIETPNIDRLADEGMRFTDAHAPGPLCHMSRYGLMTGRYPFRIEVNRWRTEPLIEEGEVTVPSLLAEAGYRTAMVGKWHVGFDESKGYDHPLPGGPADRGFHTFFGIRASTDIPPYFYIRDRTAVAPPTEHIEANASENWSPIQGAFWREGGIAPDLKLEAVLPRFTDEAIAVIEAHTDGDQADQPLMLYLAYPAPHTPWLPAEEFVGKSEAGMYGDFTMMVDHEIGRVLASLETRGISQETLVIFTSDNGPVWYPEDTERLGHDSSGGLRGMKADAWEAGHRMPFIVRWPGTVAAGSVSHHTLSFTDVLATFAEMLGRELPEGAGPDSFSFLPNLKGGASPRKSPVVMKSGSGHFVIRDGDWKLIDRLGSGGFTKPNRIKPAPRQPAGQLYNLSTDLAETRNLYTEEPGIVKRLATKRDQIIAGDGSR